jgi:TonB family protein
MARDRGEIGRRYARAIHGERGAFLVVCLACLAFLACSETPARAEGSAVEPPSRVDGTAVPYPASATGRASVLLELVVDRDGSVAASRVVVGSEPFAGTALAASRSWRFTPATRDREPAQARIRVRIDFTPPGQTPIPDTRAGEGEAPRERPPLIVSPPVAAPPQTPPPQVVLVRGVRPIPGRHEMRGAEVRQMPGSFGDAFRAIEALPGVIPLLSGLPYFLVRGAPPGNTGFFIDGVRVPALFHLGVGAAVIHPGLVDRVDFYPGAYPARFGRFTGGILSGEILPPPDQPHAEASVRLLDVGGLVSAPIDEGRGDILASGRYGYPGPLLSLFAPNTSLAYWDYQTRLRWRTSDRDEVSVFAFGSYDSLSQRDPGSGQTTASLGIQFHRVDLRWDRKTSATGRLRLALTLGYDRSSTGDASQPGLSGFIESGSAGLRMEWVEQAAASADVRIGADVSLEGYHVLVPTDTLTGMPGGASGDIGGAGVLVVPTASIAGEFRQTDLNSGVYAELAWRPARPLELRPGLRVDAFTSRSPGGGGLVGASASERAVGAFDPRLAARWDVVGAVALIAAFGVAHQASNIPFPSPGLQFSQLERGLQSATQYSAGVEVKLPAELTATVDAFLHDYTGLADYIESCPRGMSTCTFDGRAVGLEALVRRSLTKRVTGWVSYTLSRAERDAFYLGRWIRRLSEFDRTHVVNFVFVADLGARWRAGARLVAYSGLPYSTTTGGVGAPDARAPPFFRIDARLEKRWRALGGDVAFVVEWLNVLLAKESISTPCAVVVTGDTVSSHCAPDAIGPITFPSVGLEASW